MSSKIKNYFGIDFGTTSSATVGYSLANKKAECFFYGDSEGRPIPSVIAIDKNNGEIFTGREAWDKKMELSESCEYISSIKTLIDSDVNKEIAGKLWTPVDMAESLFKTLKESVRNRTAIDMEEATVAIPIGFSAKKREKLREAARRAGIRITSFVSEPTAAFFANYEDLKSSSIVAVFDWGGGTLDVSIIQHTAGKVSELATAGKDVAGDYIDDKLARRIHAKISRKKGLKIAYDDMPAEARDLLRVRVERAKRALGDDDAATISINNYGEYGVCRETLDYDWFSEIINPEVELAISCLEEAIEQSGVGLANIDRIILVGGSSNLRPLIEKMEEKYEDQLFFPDETMWNVGQGSAQLAMTPGNYYSNQSVGIVMSDDSYFELLSPDTELNNWKKSCHLGIIDSSDEARFVFSGSQDIDEDSDKYKILELPAYQFMEEQISVEASVDQDMIFSVLAGSNMRSKEFHRVWEYPRLKCYYKLPKKQV